MMAFVENIIHNDSSIDAILKIKKKKGIQYIEANNTAAITIQRYYRGYNTRLYLSNINLAATVIQKNWKGYITRRYYDNLVIKIFIIKSFDYYNTAATIIQKYFKGYYSRKYYLDIKKNKKWIMDIQKKNYAMSEAMQDYKQNICFKLENIHKEKVKRMIIDMINKHHPMLRTISIKGVFSKKENISIDSEFEKLIRHLYTQINKNTFKT